jgi:antitoxin (DNA-binding transcriptional repressor) of toxin-antitoxin stability system
VKRLRLSAAVRPLADYIADFQDETVALTESDRAVAAIVPLKNVDRESLALSQHPEFLELIARSRAEFSAGRTISLGEMKRRVLPTRLPNKRIQRRRAGRAAAEPPAIDALERG